MKTHFPRNRAFTLIELLIVVAIIAILAAIAVPNFLEAQTRSKVTRVKADMRSAATALEAYFVDWNKYVYDGYFTGGQPAAHAAGGYNFWYLSKHLSTPVAYVTNTRLVDPFRDDQPTNTNWQADNIRYTNVSSTWDTQFRSLSNVATRSGFWDDLTLEFGGWRLNGAGPDRTYGPNGWVGISAYPSSQLPHPYDPTNGTVSNGDIIRTQKSSNGYVNAQ